MISSQKKNQEKLRLAVLMKKFRTQTRTNGFCLVTGYFTNS